MTADALAEIGVSWALVGGLAVSVRAEPRFTRDIDLAVTVADDLQAEHVVQQLIAIGFRLLLTLEQSALARLASVRLLAPGEQTEGIVVDLLFASCGIEPQICRDAEILEVAPHLRIPVARTGHLIAMKVLAQGPDRPQDAIDLAVLVRDLDPRDRQRAVDALGQIEIIGANRGKALRADAERWLSKK